MGGAHHQHGVTPFSDNDDCCIHARDRGTILCHGVDHPAGK
ncbi:hypothetical protein CSB93_5844 [Pseudomonas paraeruginosa]|uniref:Uncharacterized protein n=1 Tax=Pseudomonas paraeruginosa TaxID=2994495 RepID=A0A2R3ISA1_9PSED|nr:hypothetical protein CSB93_5844 [Pseudomonas paraeruginosa]AWE91307.1 hypothetical protein CSC28_4642 [Pseudomonas paraeruginosa]